MASPGLLPSTRERGHTSDVAGAALLGCCAVWVLVCSVGRTARPEGVLLAVLAVAAGYAGGRIAGSVVPVAAATAAGLAGVGLAFTGQTEPADRAGAVAAQLTLACAALGCAASTARRVALRRTLRLAALAVLGAAVVLGSAAGAAATAAVLACSLATTRLRRRLPVLAVLALVATGAVAGCWAVAEDAVPAGFAVPLRGRLTEHRVQLWRDAADLTGRSPLRGAGPDRFGELSPTAASTPGPLNTPHSAPLQLTVGQGLPGVALVGAVFCWLLYTLGRSPRPTPVVLTAGAALTALAVESCLGNALSFPEVTAGAGLLAGLAAARPFRSEETHGSTGRPAGGF